MRWAIALALVIFGVGAATAAPEGPEEPAPHLTAAEFFAASTAGDRVHVGREILGIVVQDLMLGKLRTRNGMVDYRFSLRLRNPSQQPRSANIRLILWNGAEPAATFDVRSDEHGPLLPPHTMKRFISEFRLHEDVKLERFSLVALPARTVVLRTDRPVAVPSAAAAAAAPGPGDTRVAETPAGQGQPGLSELEQLRRQQELARWQAEMAQMYQRTIPIPNGNGLGNFVGVGPLGPQYTIGGGNGVWIQTPSGLVPAQNLPQVVNPNVMWFSP